MSFDRFSISIATKTRLIVALAGSTLLFAGCKPVDNPEYDDNTSDEVMVEIPDSSGSDADSDAGNDDSSASTPTTDGAASTPSATVTLGAPELTSGIPGKGPLTLAEIKSWLEQPGIHDTLSVKLPLGLKAAEANITGLDKNPMTRAKIELGRQLYFDTRLSKDNTVSCASCHHPDEGYGKQTQFGEGIAGQKGDRNSPVSYNRILSGKQFWDGRAESLEEQAKGPIENPIEMGNTHEECVATIKGVEGYAAQFAKIFPEEGITIDTIAKAIATFERALVTGPAPYDYIELSRSIESQWGDEIDELKEEEPEQFAMYELAKAEVEKLDASVTRGRDLFFNEKSNCTACHAGANFSDEKYHNLGVGMESEKPDVGRFKLTNQKVDTGAFKTPTVRNVALSAPYMHDGSQKTLEEVVEWYAKGGHANPFLSEKVKELKLSDQDKKDLVAFMKDGLTGSFPAVEVGRLPE